MNNRTILENAITRNHSGKMEKMQSLSTSCLCNKICEARHNTNDNLCICKHCYSFRQLNRYKTLREKLARNTEFLTTCELSSDDIPFINTSMFRFEAFGEIQNTTQVKNYITIAENNPHCTFALWTKNLWILDDTFKQYDIRKPSNLIIIYSEPYINIIWEDANAVKKAHPYVDKVFTVHNKESEISETAINCGSKKCAECRICYSHNDIDVINELLK